MPDSLALLTYKHSNHQANLLFIYAVDYEYRLQI